MSVQLLDKTRKIGQLLHDNHSGKVVFNDICAVMTQILNSNVLVISRKGKTLGSGRTAEFKELEELITDQVGGYVDPQLNERFLAILSTKENVNLETLGFTKDVVRRFQAIVNPIEIAGQRLGTVFMYREKDPYEIDDIILSEYGTTVVGLEMMRAQSEENEEEMRRTQVVKSAFGTLSYSEQEAVLYIFDEMKSDECILVTSRIADRVGITRSVIVNALRKLESAGVIQCRSSGMKGTYIKVVNEAIYTQLDEFRKQREG